MKSILQIKSRFEIQDALNIYHHIYRLLYKHTKFYYNGVFERIQFMESSKIVVEYMKDGELKVFQITWEQLEDLIG